jgi:hypothetical protein
MENRWQYEALGSGESREELEGLIDDVEEEDEWEVARHHHPGRFDRRAMNRMLAGGIAVNASDQPTGLHQETVRQHAMATADRLEAKIGPEQFMYHSFFCSLAQCSDANSHRVGDPAYSSWFLLIPPMETP